MTHKEFYKIIDQLGTDLVNEFTIYCILSPQYDAVDVYIKHDAKKVTRKIEFHKVFISIARPYEIMQELGLAIESLRNLTDLERLVLYDGD